MGSTKRKNLLYVIFITVFLLIGLNLTIGAQEAANGNGFRISPLRNEEVVEKGQSIEVVLEVTNPTNTDIVANVIINDFEANNVNGEPKIFYDPDTSAPGNSFKSISSAPATVNIPKDGSVKVPVKIAVKDNSTSGGYYGAVRFEPAQLPGGANVSIGASVGSLFLVTVPGELKESLEFVKFTAAKDGSNGRLFVGNSDKMQIVTELKNTGNIHVKPFGRIQISNSKGDVIEQYEFNNSDPRTNVLPGSTRKYVDEIEYSKFAGRYTISANLGYGSNGQLITAKNSFWVIPVWMLVVFIAVIIAIFVLAFVVYKKLRQTRKHRVTPRRK